MTSVGVIDESLKPSDVSKYIDSDVSDVNCTDTVSAKYRTNKRKTERDECHY